MICTTDVSAARAIEQPREEDYDMAPLCRAGGCIASTSGSTVITEQAKTHQVQGVSAVLTHKGGARECHCGIRTEQR